MSIGTLPGGEAAAGIIGGRRSARNRVALARPVRVAYAPPERIHPHAHARRAAMIFEYRAYYIMPGRMPDIQRRFADVTMNLFKKHGIEVVGFWEPMIGESNELVYICAYQDLAHRERVWKSFMADPEWQAARKASEVNGPLVERVVNKIWRPTSFSPLQ
jgi:hypothetical protein